MSSINTNVAAMTALQSLTQTQKSLTDTQNRISTGMRVAEASDNAAYWSIATTMRSDKASLSTVQDALGLGASLVDVSYTAVNSAIDVVNQIKSKLVAAREPGTDKATLNSYISGADAAIKDMTDAAGSLGAVKSRIGIQQTFVKGLMDAIDRGVSALVDADMNEESTKLQALQVQQQLGVQALSI